MKLGTVRRPGGDRIVVDRDGAAVVLDGLDLTLMAAVEDWDRFGDVVEKAAADGTPADPDRLEWRPPLPRPHKLVCIALNNSANKDRVMAGPEHPATFIKPSSSLVGHGQPIRLRPDFGRVHPEPELAVVIGKGGSDIPHADAYDHVFGYTILNDLTAPTMRGDDTFHYRAIHPAADGSSTIEYVDSWVSYSGRYKGTDTFGPIGPWIVTRDDIADPHDLRITCSHQGRVVTDDNTGNLLHKIPDAISYLSTFLTFEAGDILSMGTALRATTSGGAVQNVDLTRDGGTISVEIEGIGVLSNPVAPR